MMRKYILGLIVALSVPMLVAYAQPTFYFSGTGSSGSSSTNVNVSGAQGNSSIMLHYYDSNNQLQSRTVGTTDQYGNFYGSLNTSGWSISNTQPAYVMVNGQQSGVVYWPSAMWSSNTSASTNTSVNATSWTSNGGDSNKVIYSPSSPTFSVGQNGTIMLNGGTGGYYIASNSNQFGSSASISGNNLSFTGSQPGWTSLVVCSSGSGNCQTIQVNVTGSSNTSTSWMAPSVNQSSVNVTSGNQANISLSGGTAPYMVRVQSGTGVSTILNGNTLTVNGNVAGSNLLHICSANADANSTTMCTPVWVNVGATSTATTSTNTNTGTTGSTSANASNAMNLTLMIPAASQVRLMLNGGTGSGYYLASQSGLVNANLSGNNLTLTGTAMGTGALTICSNGTTTCLPVNVMVGQALATNTSLTGTGGPYYFMSNFKVGATGTDVIELQTRLQAEGYFNGPITGYFGPMTEASVMAYQRAHGIPDNGHVGPRTRAMLNQ